MCVEGWRQVLTPKSATGVLRPGRSHCARVARRGKSPDTPGVFQLLPRKNDGRPPVSSQLTVQVFILGELALAHQPTSWQPSKVEMLKILGHLEDLLSTTDNALWKTQHCPAEVKSLVWKHSQTWSQQAGSCLEEWACFWWDPCFIRTTDVQEKKHVGWKRGH